MANEEEALKAVLTGGSPTSFGGETEARPSLPFSVHTGYAERDLMLQMMGLAAIRMLGSRTSMVPGQLSPYRSYYDQMSGMQAWQGMQRSLQQTAAFDTKSIRMTAEGFMRQIYGRELGDKDKQQAQQFAAGFSNFLPIISQVFGPHIADMFAGTRGFATTGTPYVYRGMRRAYDPVTGAYGGSPETAATISEELHEQLFGQNKAGLQLGSLTSLQAYQMFEQLAVRGMGPSQAIGAMPLREKLREVSAMDLSDAEISRMAKRSAMIRAIYDRGETPKNIDYARAESQVRHTVHELRAANFNAPQLDLTTLSEMPGVEDMLRLHQMRPWIGKIKSIAPAINTMKDIFGELGVVAQDVPELLEGLNIVTQGGLTSRSDTQLAEMARRQLLTARRTGLGQQRYMALESQIAQTTDRLGLDRGLVPAMTEDAALFGGALNMTGAFNTRMFGSQDQMKATMMYAQLRAGAAASPVNRQLAAVMQLQEAKVIPAGSDLGLMAQAIQEGKTEFADRAGRKHSMAMPIAELYQIAQGSHVAPYLIQGAIADRAEGDRITDRYKTGELTQRLQPERDWWKPRAGGIALGLRTVFADPGLTALLAKTGLGITPEQRETTMQTAAARLSRAWAEMPMDTARSPEKRLEWINNKTVEVLSSMAEQSRAGAGAQLQAGLDKTTRAALALHQFNEVNAQMRLNPFTRAMGDFPTQHQFELDAIHGAMNVERGQVDSESALYKALGSVGGFHPLQRFFEAIKHAGPKTSPLEILGTTLGFKPPEEIQKYSKDHPTVGAIAEIVGRFQAVPLVDEQGRPRLAEAAQEQQQLATFAAGLEGGEAAETSVGEMEKRYGVDSEHALDKAMQAKLAAAKQAGPGHEKEAATIQSDINILKATRIARDNPDERPSALAEGKDKAHWDELKEEVKDEDTDEETTAGKDKKTADGKTEKKAEKKGKEQASAKLSTEKHKLTLNEQQAQNKLALDEKKDAEYKRAHEAALTKHLEIAAPEKPQTTKDVMPGRLEISGRVKLDADGFLHLTGHAMPTTAHTP